MYVEPLVSGSVYHIYNRGINGEILFKNDASYRRFIDKYERYCNKVFNTLAYNLLSNHFHIIAQVKPDLVLSDDDGDDITLDPSRQIAHLCNSHAQHINKKYSRTGALFETPFHRKCISSDDYLSTAIFYTHNNANRHGFVDDFREWPYSSYHAIVGNEPTFLSREWVLNWFGGKEQFIDFHLRSR